MRRTRNGTDGMEANTSPTYKATPQGTDNRGRVVVSITTTIMPAIEHGQQASATQRGVRTCASTDQSDVRHTTTCLSSPNDAK